jgi:NAD(P)H-nitrite reductase large subunit
MAWSFPGSLKSGYLAVATRSGLKPRIGQVLADNLSDDEAMNLVEKVINYYKAHAKKQRLGEFIDEIGFDKFKAEVVQFIF